MLVTPPDASPRVTSGAWLWHLGKGMQAQGGLATPPQGRQCPSFVPPYLRDEEAVICALHFPHLPLGKGLDTAGIRNGTQCGTAPMADWAALPSAGGQAAQEAQVELHQVCCCAWKQESERGVPGVGSSRAAFLMPFFFTSL